MCQEKKSKTQGYVKVTVEEELKRAESLDAIETGLYMSKSPVIDKTNYKLQEYVKLILREEVQKEIEKHNIDNVVRSDLQKYQQGEVLTPQLLEALIASSMEQVMDKFNEQLEENIEYHLDRISKHKIPVKSESGINSHTTEKT